MLWKKYLGFLILPLVISSFYEAAQCQASSDAQASLVKEALQKGYRADDVADLRLQSQHRSESSGVSHYYFQQYLQGLPIRSGLASIHFNDAGERVHQNLNLEQDVLDRLETTQAQISPAQALNFAQQQLAIPALRMNEQQLVFEIGTADRIRLAYQLTLDDIPQHQTHVAWIDAVDGRLLLHILRTVSCHFSAPAKTEACPPVYTDEENTVLLPIHLGPPNAPPSFAGTYNILPPPLESVLVDQRVPQSGVTLIDPLASPHGWHDTDGNAATIEFGYTRGNNVYAYYAPADASNPQAIPIVRSPGPNGIYLAGNVPWPAANSLNFNYNHNLYQPVPNTGLAFLEDAVTNLFVWNNLSHDIFYRYGFNEEAGNFQTTNHTNEGVGGDAVLAHAQIGTGNNQASFNTAPEGQQSIMRMYPWTTDVPNSIRDGAFDNLIMVHEYGHGVSFRLVSGPTNVNCLFNFEQGGEGYSDFFGLLLTSGDRNSNGILEENTLGEGVRGIGHYLINQAETESGIRQRHYTTNMDCSTGLCNEFTYADLPNMSFPHGVGFLWATMLWDMHWALVRSYGFEPNLQNVNSGAGNVRALRIVVESLKLVPCQPSFIDMKEKIIIANQQIYGGAGESIIQAAFARRGLGAGATAGGGASFVDPNLQLTKTVDQLEINNGEMVTYTLTLTNRYPFPVSNAVITDQLPDFLTVTDASPGWSVQNSLLSFPPIPNLAPNASISRFFTATVDAPEGTTVAFEQPVEDNNFNGFTPVGGWIPTTDNTNPNTGSTQAWFQIALGIPFESTLELELNLVDGANNHLAFWQSYDLEATLDGGVIEVEQGPNNWVDIGDRIIQNGYDAVIRDELITPIGVPVPFTTLSRRRAFTGFSGGYKQTIVDLNNLGLNNPISIRFRYASNNGNNTANCNGSPSGCDGWFLDDFRLLDLRHVLNIACATAAPNLQACGNVGRAGTVYFGNSVLPVEWLDFSANAEQEHIRLSWETRTEIDNTGFNLQRRAGNENRFTNIAWIEAAQSGTDTHRYAYADHQVEASIRYYYRLEQVDIDGQTSFSPIRQARLPYPVNGWSVFPNPASEEVRIVFDQVRSENSLLQLYNSLGKLVRQVQVDSQDTQIKLDIASLPVGVYYLRMGAQSERLVID